MPRNLVLVSIALLSTAIIAVPNRSAAQTSSSEPQQHEHERSMPVTHDKHYQDVNKHADMAMGFSHMKTTHHFGLTPSGGFIQVQTNDPKDTTSQEQIRTHLQHISKAFKEGDFSAPQMTHSRVPPGVSTMQRLKESIGYKYAETKTGGKVTISTKNSDALKAVHEFLRFQIEDHRTGDSTTIGE